MNSLYRKHSTNVMQSKIIFHAIATKKFHAILNELNQERLQNK